MNKFIASMALFLVAAPAFALVPANQGNVSVSTSGVVVSQFCNINPWSCTEAEKAVSAPVTVNAPVTLTPGKEDWYCNLNPWDCNRVNSAPTVAPLVSVSAPTPTPIVISANCLQQATGECASKELVIASLKEQILVLQLRLQVLLLQAQLEALLK